MESPSGCCDQSQTNQGKLELGYALDIHSLTSVYLGTNDQGKEVYDTTRSELGELLFLLKYRSKLSAADDIVQAASSFLNRSRSKFDLIVPVPPSGHRPVQPVIILARGIGKALRLPVVESVTTTRPANQLKGVMERERRNELLEGLYAVDRNVTAGKHILLFDDLYRSGATLNAVTDLLMNQGDAKTVRVLTVTRTRRNR